MWEYLLRSLRNRTEYKVGENTRGGRKGKEKKKKRNLKRKIINKK
jgi:hypothetical protein